MLTSNRKFETFTKMSKTHIKAGSHEHNHNRTSYVMNMHALDDILKKLEKSVKLADKIKHSRQAGLWLAENKSLEPLGQSLMDKDAERILHSENLIRKEFESKYLEAVALRRRRAKMKPPMENNLTR